MSNEEIEKTVRKYALQNAVFYGGKANPKAVSGKVLAEEPELRPRAKEIIPLINDIVEKVNQIPVEEQRRLLDEIDVSLSKREVKERVHGLPDLPGAVQGKVVMRFAPGPSGPLHLGHTRVAILNDEYCRRYDGTFINRIEDTNPDKIDPDAYQMIEEDLKWLGIRVDKTVVQSERFEIYYDLARQLIDMGKAYVCTCPMDEWRKLKEEMKPCPHRELAPVGSSGAVREDARPAVRGGEGGGRDQDRPRSSQSGDPRLRGAAHRRPRRRIPVPGTSTASTR